MSKNKVLSLLLVIILIMNIVLLSKIGDLNNRIQNLSHNYNNLQSSLNSVTSNINQSLDQFTREQSWITPIQINHEKSKVDDAQGLVVFNWQIKDYQEGSEVIFHYRESDAEAFKTITAESVGTGLFEVSLPMEVKAEPFWELNTSWTGERGPEQVNEKIVREKNQAAQTLRCYVSVENDGTIKSSEVSYQNFEYLTYMKYEPIRGHVSINDKHYNISIFEENNGNNGYESLIVDFYNGNNLVTREPLEVQEDQNGMRHYDLSYNSGSENISHVILEVKYKNGDTFQKEIY